MIDFTCPGCQSPHKANEAFAGRRAKCVRCGATLHIPLESGEATFAEHAALETDDERLLRLENEQQQMDAEEDQAGEGEESASDAASKRKKKILLIAGGILALLLIGGAIYYFASGDKPPPKKVTTPDDDDEPAVTPPTQTTPTPEPPPVKYVPPPKIEPLVINADRLSSELLADPAATELRYVGKLLEIRGNCSAIRGSALGYLLAYSSNETEGGALTVNLRNHLPKFVGAEERALSVIGGWAAPLLAGSPHVPLPRRPVVVRGTYTARGIIDNAGVVNLNAPADALYLDKSVSVTGTFERFDDETNSIAFAPDSTTARVRIDCRFTRSAGEGAKRLKRGETVTITGRCTGRTDTAVQLENAQVGGGGVAVMAAKLMADYEEDLLPYPPLDPKRPAVKATAAEFAVEYRTDPNKAEEKYAERTVELTGYVLQKGTGGQSIRFETTTDTSTVRVEAAFTKTEFDRLPTDEPQITIRGEFRGIARTKNPSHLKLENAYCYDPDANDTSVQKLTADYLPLKGNREWQAIRATFPDQPPAPPKPVKPVKPTGPPKAEKPPEHPVQRLHYRMLSDGRVQVSLLHLGGFTGDSLSKTDAPEVKWLGKPAAPNSPQARPVEEFKFRLAERYVEIGHPKASSGAEPPVAPTPGRPVDPRDAGYRWQRFLRLGAKAGKSWEYAPSEGTLVKTTVDSFGKDAADRDTVKLVTNLTDERFADRRLETIVVLTRGVGEVSRVVTQHFPKGSKVLMEQRIDGAAVEREPFGWATLAEVGRSLDAAARTAVRRTLSRGE